MKTVYILTAVMAIGLSLSCAFALVAEKTLEDSPNKFRFVASEGLDSFGIWGAKLRSFKGHWEKKGTKSWESLEYNKDFEGL